MITEEQYKEASAQVEASNEIISQYFKEKSAAFKLRMKENPIFTDDELHYAAHSLCDCGYGLAYPKGCGANHYWDCSAVLKGAADKEITHTAHLPFAFYKVKGESDYNGTTRGVCKPKELCVK
jgi:hypothetical protein